MRLRQSELAKSSGILYAIFYSVVALGRDHFMASMDKRNDHSSQNLLQPADSPVSTVLR